MKNLSYVIFLSIFSPSILASDMDSKIIVETGYNSNPHRLNEQFEIQGASFVQLNASTEVTLLKPWTLSAAIKNESYDTNTQDANETEWQLASKLKFGKASDHWGASASFSQRDKTYISRLKGGPSSYQGESLDDRYDYQQTGFKLFSKDKINKTFRNKITFSYDLKDYQDYDTINISDLDYQAYTLKERFDIIAHKKHRNRFHAGFTLRDYLNREQKDSNGSSISGSQLQYHYTFAGYEYRYKNKKSLTTRAGFDWEKRTDNSSGYYDSNAITANLAIDYHWNTHHNSEIGLKWRDFAYQRDIELTSSGEEEEFNSETRLQLNLNHYIKWPALLGKKGELALGYQMKNANANRSAYQYQQQIIHAGIKLKF